MTLALASPSSASALWYMTRGTGTVALVLLTVVMVLGIMSRAGGALPACPRFVTPALHRNLSLLAVAFLVIHIVTAVADPYAPIRLLDAVVPFVSAYRPIWLGLGALAFDILLALVVTSLLRARLGHRLWRAVHWAAYASWPIAVAHGLGSGTDVKAQWLLLLTVVSGVAVVAAVVWRIRYLGPGDPPRRRLALGTTIAVPLLLILFAFVGPLAPHWAARAGTPTAPHTSVAPTNSAAVTPVPTLPRGTAAFHGTSVVQQSSTDVVTFAGQLRGTASGRLRITLSGRPAAAGGIVLSAGNVTLAHGSARYRGAVTMLQGGTVGATLTGPAGQVHMIANLSIAASRQFSGTVSLT